MSSRSFAEKSSDLETSQENVSEVRQELMLLFACSFTCPAELMREIKKSITEKTFLDMCEYMLNSKQWTPEDFKKIPIDSYISTPSENIKLKPRVEQKGSVFSVSLALHTD